MLNSFLISNYVAYMEYLKLNTFTNFTNTPKHEYINGENSLNTVDMPFTKTKMLANFASEIHGTGHHFLLTLKLKEKNFKKCFISVFFITI